MFKLGPGEIALIAAVVLIFFGPRRLPELGKSIGEFFKNFRGSVKDIKDTAEKELTEPEEKKP